MKKIKLVIRKNLPETNSSSSHSVVIDMRNIEYNKELWDFPIDELGNIIIQDNGVEFGRAGWEKSNSVLTKTLYACGLAIMEEDYYGYLKLIRDVIVEVTGCRDVLFKWLEDKLKMIVTPDETLLSDFDEGYAYFIEEKGGPDIDHQSLDLYEHVLESKDTIREFIFNSRSWLFIGSDEIDVDEKIFNISGEQEEDNGPKNILRLDLGEEYIDFPLECFPCDLLNMFSLGRWWIPQDSPIQILKCIYFSSTGVMSKNKKDDLEYEGIDVDSHSFVWSNSDKKIKLKKPYTIITEEFGEISC